jgi:hypothetical protein
LPRLTISNIAAARFGIEEGSVKNHHAAGAQAYLQSSIYCDIASDALGLAARNIVHGQASDREKAVSLFYWVRDNIKYELGLKSDTASSTLLKGSGSCINKANLVVALLRVIGIPAGFHIMMVKTKEYFGCLCTPRFNRFMSERSIHAYGAVSIGGKWLKIDPSDDIRLSNSTRHIAVQATPISFDGCFNACLHIRPDHIISDSIVPAADVDEILSKKRRVPATALEVMNQYLGYLRRHGIRYVHPAEVERDFFRGWRPRGRHCMRSSWSWRGKWIVLQEVKLPS